MRYICIMGRRNSGKSTVEKYLENMGFTRSISYTTREPQFRDGKLEENGVEYRFVDRNKFMELVDKGRIVEYEQYGNNLYGTPEPFGATRYVSVVCIGGYKALKELYGEQVVGVYLKCDKIKAIERGEESERERIEAEESQINEMEDVADIIIDSNQDINIVLSDILKEIRRR